MKKTRPLVAALVLVIASTGIAASASAISFSGSCAGANYTISTVGSTKSQMVSSAIPIPTLMAGVRYQAAKPGGGSEVTWGWSPAYFTNSIVSPAALSERTAIRGWQKINPTPNSCYTTVVAT